MAVERNEQARALHHVLTTIAVTGTNGKTTTSSMIAAMIAAAHELPLRITTLGAWVGEKRINAANASDEFFDTLSQGVAAGARKLALEVTSKALAQGFAKRWPPHVAVFTNLTRDHLDMHKSGEAYLAAKAQLFINTMPGGAIVLNADDPSSALIDEVVPAGIRRYDYGTDSTDADLSAQAIDVSVTGTHVALRPSALATELGGSLTTAAVGRVHGYNAMAAALAGLAVDLPPEAIRAGLANFRGVPGRFEIVAQQPITIVDYAHTPDGLAGTLASATELVSGIGRVICVFGCGGNRDRGKRPQMAAIADRYADVVYVTNDNPRFENPAAIADDIERGASTPTATWHRVLSRPQAIRNALSDARPQDVVVIAGKGHEDYQEIRGDNIPMSDRELALDCVQKPLA